MLLRRQFRGAPADNAADKPNELQSVFGLFRELIRLQCGHRCQILVEKSDEHKLCMQGLVLAQKAISDDRERPMASASAPFLDDG